jgi:acetyl-CoA carboxylase biotin carboxyl carrier protein
MANQIAGFCHGPDDLNGRLRRVLVDAYRQMVGSFTDTRSRRPPARTTSAPAARAIAAVGSRERSSATSSRAQRRRARKGAAQAGQRRRQARGLITRRDDHAYSLGVPGGPLHRLDSAQHRSPSDQEAALSEVAAHITGTVWKIECQVGDAIDEGDTVAILESMKMEMPVEAEDAGTVKEILCEEGQAVNEGDTLVVLE